MPICGKKCVILHLDFARTLIKQNKKAKEMDKNTIIGFVLIALVLIGFSWYNQPSAEQIELQRKEDSIAAVITAKTSTIMVVMPGVLE